MTISRVLFLDDDSSLEPIYKSLLNGICVGYENCHKGICDNCYLFFNKYDNFIKSVNREDIVILDFLLEDIKNGLDVAIELREKFGKSVYIILHSAFIGSETTIEGIRSVVDKIILKPNYKELVNLIKEKEREKSNGIS